jgi:hypothetical protein
VNEVKQAGQYTADLNAAYLTSGIYFCRLTADEFTNVIKLVLMK